MTDYEVLEDDSGRLFVEHEGERFYSDDLPVAGSTVALGAVYTSTSEERIAEVFWDADTPSGVSQTDAKA